MLSLSPVPALLLVTVLAVPGAFALPQPDRSREGTLEPGPIRWLMRPAEYRRWRGVQTASEASSFLQEFWGRRDPTPGAEGNARQAEFQRRVREADSLFDGEGVAGSLTSRGRAYLLLGAPSSLRQDHRLAPALGAAIANGPAGPRTQPLLIETWSWRPEDLTPALRRRLHKRAWKIPLELRFRVEAGRYVLLEGEELLEVAALSWVEPGAEGELP